MTPLPRSFPRFASIAFGALLATVAAADASAQTTLTVLVEGGGTGNVTGAGIACPADCTESYSEGTEVTLTAAPTGNSYFGGWSGACSGTGTCTVTMGADLSVTASFRAMPSPNSAVYRLGEDDINAFAGAAGDNPTREASLYGPVGLGKSGTPVYVQGAGGPESLAMYFGGAADGYALTDVVSTATDNFGLEVWVKADNVPSSLGLIAYVGDSATSGFGMYVSDGHIVGLYGGVTFLGAVPLASFANHWTHLALVRSDGMSTFYVNGIPADAAEDSAPAPAAGHTMIGRNSLENAHPFAGAIDHVRFFTHAGSFSPLNMNVRLYQAMTMGAGSGTLAADAGRLICEASMCAGIVPPGTNVTLTATPTAGSTIAGWFGCDTNPTPSTCTVAVVNNARFPMVTFDGSPVRRPRDADGSGTTDVFWRDPNGQAALWLMNGTSVSGSALLLGPGTGWTAEFTADFNNDGRADILWKHTSGMWSIWLLDGGTVIDSGLILGPGTGWSAVHIGDFDNDGRSDIVWKHTDGSVAIWAMNGLSVLASSVILGPNAVWTPTHLADLNGDLMSDIVFRNVDGSVSAWLMNGLSVASSGFIFGPGSSWQVIRTGTFDTGTTTDLLWRDGSGALSVWLMNGLTPTQTSVIYNGGAFDVTHVGDFNGDGMTDILFADAGGQVSMWLMDGATVAGSGIVFGGGGGWGVTHVGDYDGDGRTDLQWKDVNGQVSIWTMNGLAVTGSAVIFGGNGGWVAIP